jgi:hypothetical protein
LYARYVCKVKKRGKRTWLHMFLFMWVALLETLKRIKFEGELLVA